MALLPWTKATVTRIEEEAKNTRRFFIRMDEFDRFDFKPGQFVTLDLPIHEKPNKRWRSYSIASWPDGTNVFELLIVLLEGGAGSSYLFNEVFEGSELTVRGPLGVFTLPEVIDRDLYFICTGTGIAPFRSMLHHIHNEKLAHQKLNLVFGCRTREDLLYLEEMRRLETEIPGFNYIPTLSREDWDGHNGYVHAVYENIIHKSQAETSELPPSYFYLCGWKNMVDEAKHRILDLGYDKKAVHLELYG